MYFLDFEILTTKLNWGMKDPTWHSDQLERILDVYFLFTPPFPTSQFSPKNKYAAALFCCCCSLRIFHKPTLSLKPRWSLEKSLTKLNENDEWTFSVRWRSQIILHIIIIHIIHRIIQNTSGSSDQSAWNWCTANQLDHRQTDRQTHIYQDL